MSRMLTRGSLCASVLLFGLAACIAAAAQLTNYIVMRETVLRKRATRVVMPAYPERARKLRAEGVAVGEVEINGRGEVISAKALQAPEESIEKALVEALTQWRFEPVIENGVSLSVKGKLTFYYVIEGDKFFVKNPRQF